MPYFAARHAVLRPRAAGAAVSSARWMPALVGRGAELERLAALLERARAGAGADRAARRRGRASARRRLAAELARSAPACRVLRRRGDAGPDGALRPARRRAARPTCTRGPAALDDCGPLRAAPRAAPARARRAGGGRPTARRCSRRCAAPSRRDRAGARACSTTCTGPTRRRSRCSRRSPSRSRDMPLLVVAAYRSDGLPRDARRCAGCATTCAAPAGSTSSRSGRSTPTETSAAARGDARRRAPAPALVARRPRPHRGHPVLRRGARGGAARSAARCARRRARLELAGDGDVPLPDTVRDAVLIGVAELSRAVPRARPRWPRWRASSFDLRRRGRSSPARRASPSCSRSGVVREGGDGTGAFRHALTREALYADLPWMCAPHAAPRARRGARAPRRAGARRRAALARRARRGARPRPRCCARRPSPRPCTPTATPPTRGRQALELWPDGDDPRRARRGARALRALLPARGRAGRGRAGLARAASRSPADRRARSADAQRSLAAVHELRGDREAAIARPARRGRGLRRERRATRRRRWSGSRIANQRRALRRATARPSSSPGRAARDADRAGRLDLRVRALGHRGHGARQARRLRRGALRSSAAGSRSRSSTT